MEKEVLHRIPFIDFDTKKLDFRTPTTLVRKA